MYNKHDMNGQLPPTQEPEQYSHQALIIALIVVVVLGAIVYVVFSQLRGQIAEVAEEKTAGDMETNDWKIYRNEELGLEFWYPADFQIITNEVLMIYPNGKQWHRFEIKDSQSEQEPYMIFEINADGYGPFFPTRVYTLKENLDGSLKILNKEVQTSDYSDENFPLIIVRSLKSNNGYTYSWRFSYKKGEINYEKIFDQILSTFQFLE